MYYFVQDRKIDMTLDQQRILLDVSNSGEVIQWLISTEMESNVKEHEIKSHRYVHLELSEEGVLNYEQLRSSLSVHEDVEAVYPYYERDQIEEDFHLAIAPRLNVKLKSGTEEGTLKQFIKEHPLELIHGNKFYQSNRYLIGHVDGDVEGILTLMHAMEVSGLFEYAEPDFLFEVRQHYTPNDPLLSHQWPVENTGSGAQYDNIPASGVSGADMNVKDAWDIATGSSDIRIAIVESEGVDYDHPDLQPNLVQGWDAEGYTNGEYLNPNPHATAVAGLAAGKGDNEEGIAGICYDCSIVPVRIGNFSASSYIALAMEWAWHPDHGAADIINTSFGIPLITGNFNDVIKDAVNLGRCGNGTPIVSSAGNNNSEQIEYPAILPETFTISGSNMCDELWHYEQNYPAIDMCCFSDVDPNGDPDIGSSFGTPELVGGEWRDGVNFAAPAAQAITTDILSPEGYDSNDDYIHNTGGGTSISAPLISGTIGLMLSANADLTVDEIEEILAVTADKIDSDGQIDADSVQYTNHTFMPYSTWNKYFGYGRVNTAYAVDMAEGYTTSPLPGGIIVVNETDCEPPCLEYDGQTYTLQSPMGDYGEVKWYRDGELFASDVEQVNVSKPGIYEVRHNGVHCAPFELRYCCEICPQADPDPEPHGEWFIGEGEQEELSDGLHRLAYESIIIESDSHLEINDATVVLRSCAEIIVEERGVLEITDSEITTCGTSWKGVKVIGDPFFDHLTLSPHGRLYMNNSTIRDAYLGVYSVLGGFYDIDESAFRSNYAHIKTSNFGFDHEAKAANTDLLPVIDNKEPCHYCPSCSYTFPDIIDRFHVKNSGTQQIDNIEGCNFYGYMDTTHTFLSYGVVIENGGLFVDNSTFQRNFSYTITGQDVQETSIMGSTFETYNSEARIIDIQGGGGPLIQLSANEINFYDSSNVRLQGESITFSFNVANALEDFPGFHPMIEVVNSDWLNIDQNTFNGNGLGSGVLIQNIGNGLVTNNDFIEHNPYGVLALDIAEGQVDIHENLFELNIIGLSIATHELPFSSSSTSNVYNIDQNFDVFCNKFHHNNVGILGSGDYVHSSGQNSMDNDYFGNAHHDVLWDNNGVDITFYEYNGNDLLNQQGLNVAYPINGNFLDENSADVDYPDPPLSATNCYGSWKHSPLVNATHEENRTKKDESELLIYPVPFSDEFILSGKPVNSVYNVLIYDNTGRVMFQQVWKGYKVQYIDSSKWPPGLYIVHISDNNGQHLQNSKVVKQ